MRYNLVERVKFWRLPHHRLHNLMFISFWRSILQVRRITLVIGLYAFSLPTFSNEAIQQFAEFLAETDSFSGQFQQTVYDENGEILQVSKGKLH